MCVCIYTHAHTHTHHIHSFEFYTPVVWAVTKDEKMSLFSHH